MRMRDVVAGAVVGAVVAGGATAGALQVFSDVPGDHPFAQDISWMASTGISEGYQDGTYRPTAPVTRQAMSAFLRRLAGADPDVDPMVDAASVDGLTAADIGWHGTAVVESSGTISRGTAASASRSTTGTYRVYFGRDVSACTYQATVGTTSIGSAAGFATVATDSIASTGVFVRTFNADGVIADGPFHLHVVC